jgi:hypothetical protein
MGLSVFFLGLGGYRLVGVGFSKLDRLYSRIGSDFSEFWVELWDRFLRLESGFLVGLKGFGEMSL